jgi:hypothetical protein
LITNKKANDAETKPGVTELNDRLMQVFNELPEQAEQANGPRQARLIIGFDEGDDGITGVRSLTDTGVSQHGVIEALSRYTEALIGVHLRDCPDCQHLANRFKEIANQTLDTTEQEKMPWSAGHTPRFSGQGNC